MTRWSTPSKRPQRMTAPGPAASSRTRACVSGLPRGLIKQARARIAWRRGMVDRFGKHIGAHHHARPAAGRRVVDRAVPVGGEVTDLHGFERPGSGLQRAAGERQAERARKHLGVEGEHGGAETHRLPPASFGPRGRSFRLKRPGRSGSPSSSASSASPAAIVSMRTKPPCDGNFRHGGLRERDKDALAATEGDFENVAAAEILHGGHLSCFGSGFVADREADEIGMIELVLFLGGQDGAVDEERGSGQAFGDGAVADIP